MPAWPFALKGEPVALAALPGVVGLAVPQVLFGAPGWPVVGVTSAAARSGVAARVSPATSAATYNRPIEILLDVSRWAYIRLIRGYPPELHRPLIRRPVQPAARGRRGAAADRRGGAPPACPPRPARRRGRPRRPRPSTPRSAPR